MEKYKRLESRIQYLENILDSNNIGYKKDCFIKDVKSDLSTIDKLNIYNNYFKGRTEFFAIRFEYNNKKGYMPKVRDKYKYYNKTQRKLIDNNELYEPYSNEALIKHLKGDDVIGLYPITSSNTSYFLVFDFDDSNYKKDSLSLIKILEKLKIDYLLEISRSGKGVHVWIFFEFEKPVKDVRIIGRYIISKAIENHSTQSFKSYDRMFPSQDYITDKSFGNLIALPLNGLSGKSGFTLFVDKDFNPFKNQYEELNNTIKLSDQEFDHILNRAKVEGEIVTIGDKLISSKLDVFNDNKVMKINLSNMIEINKTTLSNKNLIFIKRLGSIINPEFYKKQRMRLSTYDTPRIIELYQEDEMMIYLPKGLNNKLITLLNQEKISYELLDNRRIIKNKNDFSFRGKLKPHQEEVMNLIRENHEGIILAPTGFGKTVVGIKIIEELNVKTLVIVNRVNLLNQWESEIKKFLNISDVGILQGSINTLGKDIDIVTIQSLMSYENVSEIKDKYGLVLIDEVHHMASYSYENTVKVFNSKYLFGLTATIKRSDGLEEITKALVGDVLTSDFKYENNLVKLLNINFTRFKMYYDEFIEPTINDYYEELIYDDIRNRMIVKDIKTSFENNKNILVLTNRLEHINVLSNMLSSIKDNLLVVHGRLSAKDKRLFKENLSNKNENFVILATGSFIGEGFDDDRLDSLFLTMPFKWQGTLSQYVGRLNRERADKSEIVVNDYVDINVRFGVNMYEERLKGYKRLGFDISNERYKKNVYNTNNYKEHLIKDINECKSCKLLVKNNFEIPFSFISDINVENCLVIENETINAIVINNRTIWYGSINPYIGNNSKESIIMKINDKLLVKSIMSEISSR